MIKLSREDKLFLHYPEPSGELHWWILRPTTTQAQTSCLVMDHVDDLGGLLDQLGAGHLLDLDLLQLGLRVGLCLAGGAAPVAIADATWIQTMQLSPLVLRKRILQQTSNIEKKH